MRVGEGGANGSGSEWTLRKGAAAAFHAGRRPLLFIEHIHERGGDELHDRVHDALLLLLVAAAGGHRLLGAGQAALGGLLHGSRRLRLLLLLLLDAVLEQGDRANHWVNMASQRD